MEYLFDRRLINRATFLEFPTIKVYYRDDYFSGVLLDLSELGARLKIDNVFGINSGDILNVGVETPDGLAGFIGSIRWSMRGNLLISAGIRFRFLSSDRNDPFRILIKRSLD
jgi:hypothetical protein